MSRRDDIAQIIQERIQWCVENGMTLGSNQLADKIEEYLATPPEAKAEAGEFTDHEILTAKAYYVRERLKELTDWMDDEVMPRIKDMPRPATADALREAAREVLESAGPSDLGKVQVTQHSLEQLDAALRTPPQKP